MIKVTLTGGEERIFENPDCYGSYLGWDINDNGSLSVGASNTNAYSVHMLASFPAGSWKEVSFVCTENSEVENNE